MKFRFAKISLMAIMAGTSICFFSGCSGGNDATVAVFSTDTLFVSFDIHGMTPLRDTGSFNLDSIRTKANDNNIDDSTLTVTDFSISLDPSDSVSRAIVAADAATPIVAEASFVESGHGENLFVQTPTQGVAISRLATAMLLNRDIFGVSPGFTDFKALLRNPLVPKVDLILQITPTLAPPQSGRLKLIIVISAAGKARV